jgi:5-methylcytosine-specific restriction endonuclease McrA
VLKSRQTYKETGEADEYRQQFDQKLAGSGSNDAETIRRRHAFLLSKIYEKIKLKSRDPKRVFGTVEREIIYSRDLGQCQVPACSRPDRKVDFREAEIHHIIEHSAGGPTNLENGILVCQECHARRHELQKLTPVFQEHINKIYHPENSPPPVLPDPESVKPDQEGRLKFIINWEKLSVEKAPKTIFAGNDAKSIAELLGMLIAEFGDDMAEQLKKWPVLRYPLSANPKRPFGRYSYRQVPGTKLYFCPQSSRGEKRRRLMELFSKLTTPDGETFPGNAIEIIGTD